MVILCMLKENTNKNSLICILWETENAKLIVSVYNSNYIDKKKKEKYE